MSEDITQNDGAENGSIDTAAVKEVVTVGSTTNHGGGGRRDMSACLLSIRNRGNYTALFPNQKLLDKNWERVVVEAIFSNGTLESYRICEAKAGEHGYVLRAQPNERPRYEFPNTELGEAVAANGTRHLVEYLTFDDDCCLVRVPAAWRVKRS